MLELGRGKRLSQPEAINGLPVLMKLFDPVMQGNPMITGVVHEGLDRCLAKFGGPSERNSILPTQLERDQRLHTFTLSSHPSRVKLHHCPGGFAELHFRSPENSRQTTPHHPLFSFIGDNTRLLDFSSAVKDKGVLITGAGRGIGKRLAMGFAAAGARVGLLARSQAELDVAKLEIEHAGGVTLRLRADVRDFEQMCAAVDRMQAVFGGTHVVICCAGMLGPIGPITQIKLDAWRDAIDTNIMGVVHACRAVLPQMIDRRSGKIIALAGGGSSTARPYVTAHAVSKAGVVRLVESVAEEVRDFNVQMNCMDAGASYTSMTDEILHGGQMAGSAELEEAHKVRVTGGTPPERQVQMAMFLSSPRSNHISGKMLLATEDPRKLEHQNMLPDSFTLRRHGKS